MPHKEMVLQYQSLDRAKEVKNSLKFTKIRPRIVSKRAPDVPPHQLCLPITPYLPMLERLTVLLVSDCAGRRQTAKVPEPLEAY